MNKKQEYKNILSNLLDIKQFDSSIFTNIDNTSYFDFLTTFGKKAVEKIVYDPNFEIELVQNWHDDLKNKVKRINDPFVLINLLRNYEHYELSENREKLIKNNFEFAKNKIIDEIESEFQRQNNKWKKFKVKAEDIFQQSSTWPMHIGYIFVKVLIETKSVYAPLIFKEVSLVKKGSKVFLKSEGDFKLNEKLIFILQQSNFDIDLTNEKIEGKKFPDILEFLNVELGSFLNFHVSLEQVIQKINRFKSEDIKNQKLLEFYGGCVLGLFQPAGGYVRNRMLEILNKAELESILISNTFNINVYKNNINKVIFNPKKSIFKISHTNYSQDRAIVSSLIQNTIIWGPPGTGKSQTIVNVLVNAMLFGRSTVVCSEKKAAIDVIIERLGELKLFTLNLINNSRVASKVSFYEQIEKYLKYVRQFDINKEVKLRPLHFLNQSEVDYLDNLAQIKSWENLDRLQNIFDNFAPVWHLITKEMWEKLVTFDREIKLPNEFNFETANEFQNALLSLNHVKWKTFDKKNRYIKKEAKAMFEMFKQFNWNLNDVLPYFDGLSLDDYEKCDLLINNKTPEHNKRLNDIKLIKAMIALQINEKIQNFSYEENALLTEFSVVVQSKKMPVYNFVKKFAAIIKKMFPVIVVNPDIDLTPWNKEEFDYAIIDESSQLFLEKGLPLLYLAKIKILAGDDQQMKPTNWFSIRISDDNTVYSSVPSLLDYAKGTVGHNILLDKNYRSNYAALMTFSSKEFYNESLDVIDNFSNVSKTPIEVYDIDGKWEDNKNTKEAEFAIDLLLKYLPIYEKIILLCFNSKQQDLIQTIVLEKYSQIEEAMNTRQLIIRNIENIQGDEADLVIATVCYDATTGIHGTYVGRPGGRNALNVAISRAKDKIIVIKSIKSNQVTIFNNDNLDLQTFRNWLAFLELSDEDRKTYVERRLESSSSLSHLENDTFYKKVIFELEQMIKSSNLVLKKNKNIGTIRVDLTIGSEQSDQICFLVDTYEYAGNIDAYLKYLDTIEFIRAKKYNVFHLTRQNWVNLKPVIHEAIRRARVEVDKELCEQEKLNLLEQTSKPDVELTSIWEEEIEN
ncbi:AAA domain-containing protein [Mycoplasmopsis columbinasalis]|uniref:Putative DNA helicase n=1 Tax=Mycoplasmopsis columbinasalis TaxID=114880 RepID=A0A449B9V3_9BACT|nr:DEAD/DEAH box helicase [Mycoplasmopsis columbinasalis]VEU77960.1 putative DNA helicase [Mycoplasmopsis columbinasalis]